MANKHNSDGITTDFNAWGAAVVQAGMTSINNAAETSLSQGPTSNNVKNSSFGR